MVVSRKINNQIGKNLLTWDEILSISTILRLYSWNLGTWVWQCGVVFYMSNLHNMTKFSPLMKSSPLITVGRSYLSNRLPIIEGLLRKREWNRSLFSRRRRRHVKRISLLERLHSGAKKKMKNLRDVREQLGTTLGVGKFNFYS